MIKRSCFCCCCCRVISAHTTATVLWIAHGIAEFIPEPHSNACRLLKVQIVMELVADGNFKPQSCRTRNVHCESSLLEQTELVGSESSLFCHFPSGIKTSQFQK